MELELRNNKDFWVGTMLIETGAAAVFIARDYQFGSGKMTGVILAVSANFQPMDYTLGGGRK